MREFEHKSLSEDNLEFFKWLENKNSQNYDWQVTVCFYSALHKLDYWLHLRFKKKDNEINRHWKINKCVRRLMKGINKEYSYLYGKCRYARYYQKKKKSISLSHITKSKIYLTKILNYSPPSPPLTHVK